MPIAQNADRGAGRTMSRVQETPLPFVDCSIGAAPYKLLSCEELAGKDGVPGRDSFARHWAAKVSVVCAGVRRLEWTDYMQYRDGIGEKKRGIYAARPEVRQGWGARERESAGKDSNEEGVDGV